MNPMTKDELRRRGLITSYNFEKWLMDKYGFSPKNAATYCNNNFGNRFDSYFGEFEYDVLHGPYGRKSHDYQSLSYL